jgi:hypothetical protein
MSSLFFFFGLSPEEGREIRTLKNDQMLRRGGLRGERSSGRLKSVRGAKFNALILGISRPQQTDRFFLREH